MKQIDFCSAALIVPKIDPIIPAVNIMSEMINLAVQYGSIEKVMHVLSKFNVENFPYVLVNSDDEGSMLMNVMTGEQREIAGGWQVMGVVSYERAAQRPNVSRMVCIDKRGKVKVLEVKFTDY